VKIEPQYCLHEEHPHLVQRAHLRHRDVPYRDLVSAE